jgi:hypothetical protein
MLARQSIKPGTWHQAAGVAEATGRYQSKHARQGVGAVGAVGVGERRGPTALQWCSARVRVEEAEKRNRAPAWNLAVAMGSTLVEVQEMAARFFRGRLLFAGWSSGESGDTKARGLFRLWFLYLYILTARQRILFVALRRIFYKRGEARANENDENVKRSARVRGVGLMRVCSWVGRLVSAVEGADERPVINSVLLSRVMGISIAIPRPETGLRR